MIRAGPRATSGAAVIAFVAVVLVAASCDLGSSARSGAGQQSQVKTTTVRMRDYSFDHPRMISAKRAVFRVKNEGTMLHQVMLVPLPPELKPIKEQLASTTRRGLATLAALPPQKVGQTGIFAVDLEPGRYAFLCFIRDDDGETHARKGMSSEFRVPRSADR